MPLSEATTAAFVRADVDVRQDVPLARRTWWRVGGPADGLTVARSLSALQRIQQVAADTDCPVFVLGNASNLLISDAGIRGLVVLLAGELAGSKADESDPPIITLGAGLKLVVAMKRALDRGWTGMECFAGIPGTVGGAIRMNAGSTLGETGDRLVDVTVVCRGGAVETLSRSSLSLAYRHCDLPEGAIVASARFQTTDADLDACRERVQTFLDRRKATQPLDKPSCGSTFRNPPGDHAGRLIEAAGLKGLTIGGAQVSEKHANFIVNLGSATASDIRSLIDTVQLEVSEQFGVALQREVHFAGTWEDA